MLNCSFVYHSLAKNTMACTCIRGQVKGVYIGWNLRTDVYSCKKFLSVAKMAKTVYEREMRGADKKTWKYFHEMEPCIGESPNVRPKFTLENSSTLSLHSKTTLKIMLSNGLRSRDQNAVGVCHVI